MRRKEASPPAPPPEGTAGLTKSKAAVCNRQGGLRNGGGRAGIRSVSEEGPSGYRESGQQEGGAEAGRERSRPEERWASVTGAGP